MVLVGAAVLAGVAVALSSTWVMAMAWAGAAKKDHVGAIPDGTEARAGGKIRARDVDLMAALLAKRQNPVNTALHLHLRRVDRVRLHHPLQQANNQIG